jgi:opacity protein-like surface antigen
MHRIARAPICAFVAGVLLAAPAFAADVFLSGNFSLYSTATAEASGETDFFGISGDDSDTSPAIGGTLGLAFPIDEALPAIQQFEMPSWLVRAEIEYMGGRSYDFRSDGNNPDTFFSDVDTWTVMPTIALEIPVREPIRWAFGRVPVLELMSLTGTVGVGVSQISLDVTDNVSEGASDELNFAWQGGLGLSYELTDVTTLTFGWRYLSLGTAETDLKFGPQAPAGDFELDLSSHEFTVGLRLDLYSAPLKDMHPRYWRMPRPDMPGWWPSWLGGPSDEEQSDADDL